MTAPQRPDTPLGDLIAGKIDQAEYRRRMATRAPQRPPWDPDPRYVLGPEPVRRAPEDVTRSGCVIVWLDLVVGFVLAVAVALVVLALIVAAPRAAADPTAPMPSHDVAGLALASPGPATSASGQPLPGAPHGGLLAVGAPRYAGIATWYCSDGRDGSPRSACTAGYGPSDLVAAIDSDLGIGEGERIRVTFGKRSVEVVVVDVCRCPGERLVDLTIGAFQELASWGHGVLPVTVQVIGGPSVTLPPTDKEDRP